MDTTTKELKWVLTEYGKRRITEMLNNPDERIRISILQIGDDNSGEPGDREYQDQLGSGNGKLFHQVGGDIPIYEKGISKDRSSTVYFKAIIGENMGGFNICELALFENRNGELKMFAVGTGEPIVKPSVEYGYLISVEYTLFIESANLVDVYDRIELEPANEFIKETDIEGMYKTVLYVEGNLAEQISDSTHLLGLGRAQQLNDLISNTQLLYSSSCIATYFANLANTIQDMNNLMGFWSFGYSDIYGTKNNIKDFSSNSCNFSTNGNLASYNQEYIGALSSLNFTSNDFFYLDKLVPAFTANTGIELGQLFERNESGNLIYSAALSQWSFNGTFYSEEEVKEKIIQYYLYATDVETTSTTISLGDIQEDKKAFAPHTFTYNELSLKWTNEIGTVYDTEFFKNNVVTYTGTPTNGDTISLTTSLTPSDNDTITLTGEQFDLIKYEWVPKQDGTEESELQYSDSPFTFIAVLKHNNEGERCTLLAQSNYFNSIHNFEIAKTENNAIELTLFTDKNNFYRCKTSDWVVPNNIYNLVITYDGNSRRPDVNIYINGDKPTLYDNRNKETYSYEGMQPNSIETTSYVREESTDNKINNVNAKMCLMSLIKEQLPVDFVKSNALVLNSLCGKNIYYKV